MIIFLSILNNIIYMLNGYVGLVAYIAMCVYLFLKSKKESESMIYFLVKLYIFSIPTSFINIFGGEYGNLPLSGSNIIILFSIAYIFVLVSMKKNLKIKLKFLDMIIILYLMYQFIGLIISSNKYDSITSLLTIGLPMILTLFISILPKINFETEKLKKFYVDVSIGVAVVIVIQYIAHNIFGIDIGYIKYMAGRVAIGGLFGDFSFCSLYLCSSAMMIFVKLIESKGKKFKYIFELLVLIIGSMATTARTGIVAFIITLGVFLVYKFIKSYNKEKVKLMFLMPVIVSGAYYIMNMMMKFRSNTSSIFSDSGRGETYIAAINVFKENILCGIGLGGTVYSDYVRMYFPNYTDIIPHNYIFQYLAQGGIIGILILLTLLYNIVKISYKYNNKELLMANLTILIGSFFIPNLFDSRYIFVFFIITILQSKKCDI